MKAVVCYFWNLFMAVDQLLNAIFFGDPKETVSSRLGKALYVENRNCVLCRWACSLLNKIDPDHCRKSMELNEGSRAIIGD